MTLDDDRAALRQRWYDRGFFGSRTLADALADGAARFPATTAHFVGGERTAVANLATMHERSGHVASGLIRLGLRTGDRIAIQVPNWLEGAITYAAAFRLGLVVVPIIHIYDSAEVSFIVRQSGARALVVPDRWRSIDYLGRIDRLTDVPTLEHLVIIGDQRPSSAVGWSSLERAGDPAAATPIDPDSVALIVYTSGTTAEPKGVQHTHNTLLAKTATGAAVLGQGESAVSLAAFPAGHIGGVLNLLRLHVLGVPSVLLDAWDPVLAARLVGEHRVTSSSGAPVFLQGLIEAAEAEGIDLSTLRSYMVGAAMVPPTVVEAADRVGIAAFRGYGSSEHPIVTTGSADDPLVKRATTDGRLSPGCELRLVDDGGHDVPTGAAGEIAIRGPEQFVGYSNPALDTDSYLSGAWFLTGDIGRLDDDGYLSVTDRKKDIIIRGGENIASREVEDVLARHPLVLESAVVGMPDDRLGERVCAFVIPREPASVLTVDDLRSHFEAEGVARQKTPERVIMVDQLPRSMAGKVQKFDLRAQLRR